MWRGKAKIIICLLIPVLIMGQNDQELDSVSDDARTARFGFGKLETLQRIWKAVCNETCSKPGSSRFFGSTKIFCALKCPSESSNGIRPTEAPETSTAGTTTPGPSATKDPTTPSGSSTAKDSTTPSSSSTAKDSTTPSGSSTAEVSTTPSDSSTVKV